MWCFTLISIPGALILILLFSGDILENLIWISSGKWKEELFIGWVEFERYIIPLWLGRDSFGFGAADSFFLSLLGLSF